MAGSKQLIPTVMGNPMNDVNRIASGARFVGDIATGSDIRIDGNFEGRLYCVTRVVVGEKAVIKGDIFCTSIDFSGTLLDGNFWVKDTLSLKAGCDVRGDLKFRRLQVELDARFAGKCQQLKEEEFEKASAALRALLEK